MSGSGAAIEQQRSQCTVRYERVALRYEHPHATPILAQALPSTVRETRRGPEMNSTQSLQLLPHTDRTNIDTTSPSC